MNRQMERPSFFFFGFSSSFVTRKLIIGSPHSHYPRCGDSFSFFLASLLRENEKVFSIPQNFPFFLCPLKTGEALFSFSPSSSPLFPSSFLRWQGHPGSSSFYSKSQWPLFSPPPPQPPPKKWGCVVRKRPSIGQKERWVEGSPPPPGDSGDITPYFLLPSRSLASHRGEN